jgi:predicted PurR-regulated permease PerM
MDYETVCAFFRSLIPTVRWGAVDSVLNVLKRTALQFLKSYLILFLLMFAGLFLGFALLGERYAFLFALMTAAVDSLPIFGMGIIILPLALFHFLTGGFAYGIGLCALYLILTVFRQILEPKILGAGLGIHPLVMLCTMYAGWKWFGVFGMLTAPFLTVTVKNLMKSASKENAQ